MKNLLIFIFIACAQVNCAQNVKVTEEAVLATILADPTRKEIATVLSERRRQKLLPENVSFVDTLILSNGNRLFILVHTVDRRKHYGAVIVPEKNLDKLPVVIFTTGGDGIHKEFFLNEDFNHRAVQYPAFLGAPLDQRFLVVIPSFRGQQFIIGDKKYQSEGSVSDAFDGAATDACALLNVVLERFPQADHKRIAVYGGSRGGAVALLVSARDKRIKRAAIVATPTDIRELNNLYPPQFRILFVNDVMAGKMTVDEARKKCIASSPMFFVDQLPVVQLHQDNDDPVVPPFFAHKLIDKMKTQQKEVTPYFYNEGIHGFWEDENFWRRVQAFLQEM